MGELISNIELCCRRHTKAVSEAEHTPAVAGSNGCAPQGHVPPEMVVNLRAPLPEVSVDEWLAAVSAHDDGTLPPDQAA